MNSSKTANALMTHFNYHEAGQRALLCKSETDTRDGARVVQSRIGLRQECILLCELMEMPAEEIKTYHCIIVDEVQFATIEQIDFLSDIVDFMEKNYMHDLTMEEMAYYTGRSLATFKRDFKKISDLTPEKWLIRKRLEVAYAKMKEGGKKVVDVYAEVGFKNPSHFSTAFKKQYGISPTAAFV